MKAEKQTVHFTDNALLQPTNPVEVILIGAGGTGSQVLTCLARMNHALTALGHAGITLTLWDDDIITEANLGRQLFARGELGLHKSVALINRCNRFFGTRWKARREKFTKDTKGRLPDAMRASIYITCVDNVASRFETAEMLQGLDSSGFHRTTPKYWIDYGNSSLSGQVILSTITGIKQPASEKFQAVGTLPMITEEFGALLRQSEQEDDTPSCSLAEALEKQDLFINSTLAQMGSSLLWNLFRNGFTPYRGFFFNLSTFRAQPIPVA